jgi:hypothetical protein
MGSVSQQSPLAQDFLNLAEGQQANTLGGANAQAADQQQLSAIGGANAQSANAEQLATINGAGLSQNNPYLAAYFNSAAQPLTQQFEQATAPNILANAASTGTVGSAGANQAMGNAQTALSEGLGNLASGLYEPAYAQGVQNQQNAAQNAQGQAASAAQNAQGQAASAAQSAPSLASGQYIPASQLSASGQIGQNQAQNVLSAQYQNLLSQANYPMQELGQLGTALGTASGGGGVSQSISQLLGGAGGGK